VILLEKIVPFSTFIQDVTVYHPELELKAALANMATSGSYREELISATDLPVFPTAPFQGSYPCLLPDGDYLSLPFVPLPPSFDTAIAYLCSNQTTFAVEERLTSLMAEMVKSLNSEVVVGMPTLGMVYASAVARKLGHQRYVPLGYSRKFWYEDELSVPVRSITSPDKPKTVYIDPNLLERLAGKRVLLVEDVISTGGTISAELTLMEKIGANVVGIVAAIKETNVWVEKLAAMKPVYPSLVHAPIKCPLFKQVEGGWMPMPETAPP
jgi:adenine/guanine phosphoribosyltransferase-like PRPP-binding protein